jgi:DNA-binding GntR family transcriptional regulator
MVGFRSKQEFAYSAIREAIVNGELKPKERLVISTLADGLGISEIPTREALKRLEAEGYATMTSNGMIVSSVSPEELADLLEIRIELEGIAIRRAASRIDENGLHELKRLYGQMVRAVEQNDMSEFSLIDKEFHVTVYMYCGVDILTKTIMDAWSHSERGRAIFHLAPWRTEFSMKEHQVILEALEKKDAIKAEEVLKQHKRQTFDLYISKLRSQI